MCPYTPASETSFATQHESTEAYEKSSGTKIERYMDDIYEIVNEIIEKWALVEVADITALRALYDDANWDNSTTQHIARDLQIRKVVAASDGTNSFVSLYWFDEGSSVTDADGATGNVDTDGIVSPLSGRATGRWLRIAGANTTGAGLFVHQLGLEALRTMTQYLYINLTAGASDLGLKFNKRTAGSQVKITTDEEIAIRNIADSAYEDLSIGLLTTSGNITGAGTANVLSGAPVASATSALLRLGAANTGGSASGGFISVNSATGYAGDFIRILLDGVARMTLSNAGNLVVAGNINGVIGTFTGALSSTTASHTGALNMNSQLINNVATGISGTDAVNVTQMTNAVGSGVGYTFSPLHIDSLTLWLSADQQTGYADAAVVSPWTDISGRLQACTEATNKPTYRTNVINGKATVRFDGTNDKLNSASAMSTFVTTDLYTAFAVIKTPASFAAGSSVCGIANAVGLIGAEAASNCRFGLVLDATGNLRSVNYDGSQDSVAYGSALSVATSYLVTWRHTGGNIYIQVNNGSEVSAASGTTDDLTAVLTLGYMDSAGTDYFGAVDIAEVIMYDATLDAVDILRVKNYLNTKYALY